MTGEFDNARNTKEFRRGARAKSLSLGKAEICLKIGDFDRCLAEAQAILAEDPDHVGALEVLAKAQWQIGDYEGLLAALDRLIGLNPYEPGYHALRAAACQSLGRLGQAVQGYARAGNHEEALAELQAWQEELIADLIREDRVFRAQYAQDPKAACLARGFEFVEQPVRARLVADRRHAIQLYTRPS